MLEPEDISRFNAKIDKQAEGACWPWLGCLGASGYGHFTIRRGHTINLPAHRLSLHLSGVDLPEGAHVLHSCHNKTCCNPEHLRAGTHLDNMKDKVQAGRQLRGEATPNSKLSEVEVAKLKGLWVEGVATNEIAQALNVSAVTVRRIANSRGWNHTEPIPEAQRESSLRRKRQNSPRLNGVANGHAKFTDDTIRDVRLAYANGGVTQKDLAKRFGMAQSHVSRIVSGQSWAHHADKDGAIWAATEAGWTITEPPEEIE